MWRTHSCVPPRDSENHSRAAICGVGFSLHGASAPSAFAMLDVWKSGAEAPCRLKPTLQAEPLPSFRRLVLEMLFRDDAITNPDC